MPVTIGTQLGSYEIIDLLGKGGMGEVYRARDLKLKREVAIKILPEEFSRDGDRESRFQREAEVLASLNHPHIAAIYGLEVSGGRKFLVMELVGGKTLAERIQRGPIPVDEALGFAKQIAEALEAAHEKGIIHRDLKPGNVMIAPSREVKVLDFGLAKVRQTESDGASLSDLPTMITVAGPGMILGTAAYMSPEQAKGNDADRTADVWAFGCVLYEMLTGRTVFQGETVGEIFAGVLKTEPDWRQLPAETPEGIRRLLRRCLQKNPRLRFRDIGDVRIEIEEVQNGSSDTPTAKRHWTPLALTALTLVSLCFGAAIVWIWRTAPSVSLASELRLDIVTPPTADPVSLAISPDGQKIVFAATLEGRHRLWVRSLNSASAHPLVGADDASHPFWSPDSRSVGFFADGMLKRIDIDGGSVQMLANAPNSRGGTWNRDGTILFSPINAGGSIFRVSATGGEATVLTRLESPQQTNHGFPQFLPDGRHFLYYVTGSSEARGVYISKLDGSENWRVLDADAPAVYASSGQLLFVRQGTLFAQDFNPVRLALTGNPFPVAEQVLGFALSASAGGPIAYRARLTGGGQRQFVWFDRSGKEIEKVGDPDSNLAINPSLSPGDRRIALQRTVNGNTDIWLLETASGVLSRFTFYVERDGAPIWSPDASNIVFGSNRKGVTDLYQRSASGGGREELLLATPQNKAATDWSPDGRFLLYRSQDLKTNYDIWALPMERDRKPFPVVQTNFDERDAQFSPDGKWIAYQSNESGRFEIYLEPFPGPGGKWQISANGGTQVRWRHDGKELFYIALDGWLVTVPIRLASEGHAVEVGAPVLLFVTRIGGALQGAFKQQYTVSSDGQKFLMNTVAEEATSPITVILNWKPKP